MELPDDRVYSEYHLWVKREPTGVRIGMSHWGCDYLGAIDYIELPEAGQHLVEDSPFGWVETSKAISELVAPISGLVLEANRLVLESPQIITEDPYRAGWFLMVQADSPDTDHLLSSEVYGKMAMVEPQDGE